MLINVKLYLRGEEELLKDKIKYKFIIFSILLGIFGWIIDAIFDSIFLYQKTFLQVLITDIPSYEIYIRTFVSVCFFLFGIILSKNLIQRKQTEKELEKANNALNLANKDLEGKVKKRTSEVEKLLNQREELIVQIGHDIKTPLTPLMGLLPLAARNENDPKVKEILNISIRNVNLISDLVNKTINLARLNSDLFEFILEPTNLRPEVDKVIKNNKFMLDCNDIYVENNIDEEVIVKADRLRLREIFTNLITNSAKFTPDQGGIITINAKKDENFITVTIKDKGIGMAEEQLDRVFDELYKVDPSRHDINSKGLGLPICKRIIEKHGGRIWVESPGEGKGTTVFFTIPLSSKTKDNIITVEN